MIKLIEMDTLNEEENMQGRREAKLTVLFHWE